MRQLVTIIVSLALALSGCVPSELNRFEFEVSQQICSVDALAEEKNTSLSLVNSSKRSIAPYQNKSGSYDEDTYTILDSKLNRYEAELEATYRFATQNCGAYMRCIERNGHQETECLRSERRWADAQERFNRLSVEIREIAAEVEIAKAELCCRRGRRGPPPPPPPVRDRERGCCRTINNVFTDCCD